MSELTTVKLQRVRLSFPDLWVAVEFKTGDGKPRFNATFLVEPGSDNDKKIKAAINAAIAETYPDVKKADSFRKASEGQTNKWAYADGNKTDYDGYENMMSLACHNKTKPKVFDSNPKNQDGSDNLVTAESGKVYAGCYVNAKVEIYAQKGENPGLRASFSGVQFAANGDAFGGGTPASSDDFDAIADGSDAEDMV